MRSKAAGAGGLLLASCAPRGVRSQVAIVVAAIEAEAAVVEVIPTLIVLRIVAAIVVDDGGFGCDGGDVDSDL